jgi:hypothetical protein
MLRQSWLLGTLALALAGCDSHATTICEKLDECNQLRNSTVSECSEGLEENFSESWKENCAECMNDESCSSIRAWGCADACPALFE